MISYFQDSHTLHYNGHFYNAKSSSFFDRFTANLRDGEKLNIYMRQKQITDPSVIPSLMEVSTDKITFHEMPSFWNILNWPKIVRIIKQVIDNSDFSYLRAEGIYGSLAGFFCIRKHVKYMTIMPADPEVGLKEHGIIGHIVSFFHVKLVKYVVKRADYAYYVTQSYLQKKYPSDGVVLGCSDVQLEPIDDEILDRRLKKIEAHKEKLVLGTAGALLPMIKGQDLVLKAIAQVRNAIDVEYHLVGMGNSEEIISIAKNEGVEDLLFIEGTLPHGEVFKWMDNIDIYIQPSRTEGLPRAVVEAMSRALPCIGSEVGGIPELLEDKWLFKHGIDAVERIKTLLFSINNDVLRDVAIRNFQFSKSFERNLIEKKNKDFFKEFDNFARGEK